MTATIRGFENRQWLLNLLDPQAVAEIDALRPLSTGTIDKISAVLDKVEALHPQRAALMTASADELPAVLERILAGQVPR